MGDAPAVEIATSVADATPMLHERQIDAVILDVRMTPQSGLDLLPVIRDTEKLRDIPAVVLTEYLDRVTRRPGA